MQKNDLVQQQCFSFQLNLSTYKVVFILKYEVYKAFKNTRSSQIQHIDSVILDLEDSVSLHVVLHFKEVSPSFPLQLRGSVLN